MTIHVLFVDDEANVLAGLRRMLRGKRDQWQMSFVGGGEEALQYLKENSVDVIVTDMCMPGIDGTTLLTEVATLYPKTARLVLSGQSEQKEILRTVGLAHQFLSKPCDPGVLIETIECACGRNSQLRETSLLNLTSQLKQLPSLPDIYHELVEELNSDSASMRLVGEKIASDLAMAAKVLQLVNSSFFGLPRHISCPKHAVSLLGLNIIQPLVLSAAAFSSYSDPGIPGFSLERLSEHCLAVATTARRIATNETDQEQIIDQSFIAGLMHDVGKIILAANLPKEFTAAIELAGDTGLPLYEAELQVFGASHAEVGAHLLELWGIPDPIVQAIAFHHRPLDAAPESSAPEKFGPDDCEKVRFGPLTAVHAADALHPISAGNDLRNDEPAWDQAYLELVVGADRMEHWRSLVCGEPTA